MAEKSLPLWLIVNSASTSTNAAAIEGVSEALTTHGARIARTVDLATDTLPDKDEQLPDWIVSFGGDGTANAIIDAYGTKEGPVLLILPGGTMNLLASRLHGVADAADIIAAALSEPDANIVQLPQIEGPNDLRSLVGIIAGTTTAWGEVREHLRQGAIGALVQAVPKAFDTMYNGDPLRVEGLPDAYPALFIEVDEEGLIAHAIQADTPSDIARHGIAWLMRNFLGGPTEELLRAQTIKISAEDTSIDLLVDGEPLQVDTAEPLVLTKGLCEARLVCTAQQH